MSATYSDTQVMMTLAAFAATAATPRPSGETWEAQQRRISKGITRQLADNKLATQAAWTLTWVGLTQSGANLAYIAQGPDDNGASVYALVLRGTVGGSPIDTAEDMHVGIMLPFAAGGTAGNISQGAMEAFTDIIMGTGLVAQLQSCNPGTLYVVGHSLGGAMVTTVSLYLAQQVSAGALQIGSILPYTFAAPTAGDKDFAKAFDRQFRHAVCTVNFYDLVPHAWATLKDLAKGPHLGLKKNPYYPFYPGPDTDPTGPGPTADTTVSVRAIIDNVAKDTNDNVYVQPTQQSVLNQTPPLLFLTPYPSTVTTPVQQFEVQVGFQHANNTYLTLLGAPTLPETAPVVASVSPTSGPAGTPVTITPPAHMHFAPDSVVDFGIVPAASCTVAQDGTSISAVAPQGVGTVDIRVTNKFGTSPALPVYPNLTPDNYSDQFTFTAS